MLWLDVEANDAGHAKLFSRLNERPGASSGFDNHALGEVRHDTGDIREEFAGKCGWGVELLFAGHSGVARARHDGSRIGHAPRLTTSANGLF